MSLDTSPKITHNLIYCHFVSHKCRFYCDLWGCILATGYRVFSFFFFRMCVKISIFRFWSVRSNLTNIRGNITDCPKKASYVGFECRMSDIGPICWSKKWPNIDYFGHFCECKCLSKWHGNGLNDHLTPKGTQHWPFWHFWEWGCHKVIWERTEWLFITERDPTLTVLGPGWTYVTDLLLLKELPSLYCEYFQDMWSFW